MSYYKPRTASAPSEPRRALSADFTAHTIRYATTAKRRMETKQQFKNFLKEPFSMRSLKFLHTLPGAVAVALTIIATTGVSAFALTNWFNGAVTVKQDDTVLSIDLSQCKGSLPPGIDTNTDRSKVQFKILGDPHITAERLQQELLAECEFYAVLDFYKNIPHTKNYSLHSSTVKAISDKTITLDYSWGGQMNKKIFTLSTGLTVYDQGKPANIDNIKTGDMIIFAVNHPERSNEHIDPFTYTNEVASIFKTQHDTKTARGATKKGSYEENNIMPLNMYEQLHNK